MKPPVFGRRDSGAASTAGNTPIVLPRPQPDADGVKRVLSKSLFEGPAGEMLTGLGFSPDNPFNIIPEPEAQDARRHELAAASQTQFVARITAQLPPGIVVKPWALIPASLWAGEHANFLNRVIGLTPASPDNTMLLGGNLISALSLNLPELPPQAPTEIERLAGDRLTDLQRHFQEDWKNLVAGNRAPNREEISRLRAKYLALVIATAKDLGVAAFGEQAWLRHQALFGKALAPRKD